MSTSTEDPRIVVGVDGSVSSVIALQRAAELAEAVGASLEAITTWEYPVLFDPYYAAMDWSPHDEAAKALAQTIDDAIAGAPPRPILQTVLQGPAARVLIHESAGAYLLVLGSRGHGGFAGLLLGSVSAACAAHAECPVLIIHTPKTPPTDDL